MNGGFTTVNRIKDDERVDLEVGKVKIDIDGVKPDKEVDQGILFFCGNMFEESGSNVLTSRERSNHRNIEDESFGIHITDVDTTLVREEDAVTFTLRGDANIIFGVGGVRKERLDDKIVQGSGDGLNLTRVA